MDFFDVIMDVEIPEEFVWIREQLAEGLISTEEAVDGLLARGFVFPESESE